MERPKFVIYDKSETLFESVATDVTTFLGLVICMWLSHIWGGGAWTGVTIMMFGLWCAARMPWERMSRITTMRTKAEALAWAAALPEDDA